ncbi:MAG TPA: transcriptional repressor LexA [Candidatus Paceibacterota bacterium]|nr:transcriptional repressor LexA [Verrucomicrobiota bacterium]HRY51262.1 transcriptional repressor LexA [Candidatus Paceibacterota bacterium]
MSTKAPTERQQEILDFIQSAQHSGEGTPSLREIAAHFGFRSMNAAADHVRALRRKKLLDSRPHQARSLRALSRFSVRRRPIVDIPVFGTIPAGPPADRYQEAEGCVSVDVESLGIRPTARTFALKVRGDSMIGKHIVDGDCVILEHGMTPRSGDVVAALIDNESTLKTFVIEKGKPYLRAENPRYPALVPAGELVIQGVMVALLRRTKPV